jgi:hypothetical protein
VYSSGASNAFLKIGLKSEWDDESLTGNPCLSKEQREANKGKRRTDASLGIQPEQAPELGSREFCSMYTSWVKIIRRNLYTFLKDINQLIGETLNEERIPDFITERREAFKARRLRAFDKASGWRSTFVKHAFQFVNSTIYVANGAFVVMESRTGCFRGDVYGFR